MICHVFICLRSNSKYAIKRLRCQKLSLLKLNTIYSAELLYKHTTFSSKHLESDFWRPNIWIFVFYGIFTGKSFSHEDFILTLLIFCGLCFTFSDVIYSKAIFKGYYTKIATKINIPLFLCHGYLLIILPPFLEDYNKYYSVIIFLTCALITSILDVVIVKCIKKCVSNIKSCL